MNIAKRLYCRGIMGTLYVSKPFLPYRKPKILESIGDIPAVLNEQGKSSVLLVSGRTVRAMGATGALEAELGKVGISCTVYEGTRANPTVENVEEALKLYHANRCDAIIAFGGGSPIDCAKTIGARVARPDKSVNQMGGTFKVLKKPPLLIAIPTTAGTGSEATPATVITDTETGHKYTINDFYLSPDYAVLDPYVTFSLPPRLTASTGIDALSHAIEAYVGKSTSKESRGYSLEAIKLIFENLETAYKQGDNYEARASMLKASYLAGMAISLSYVGYAHAIAHSLGGNYNLPHGQTVAVVLPVVLEAYGSTVHQKLYEIAVYCGFADTSDSPRVGAEKLMAQLYELYDKINIPRTIEGIRPEDISEMAKHADSEANPLYAVPVLWDAQKLAPLYERIADWGKNKSR